MKELLLLVAEVIAEVIILAILWITMFSVDAWLVSLLTGDLHNSGLDEVPALSFRQSYLVVVSIYLLSTLWHAGRISK